MRSCSSASRGARCWTPAVAQRSRTTHVTRSVYVCSMKCRQQELAVAWRTAIRPRLDALNRRMAQTTRNAIFLQRLDDIYMLLSNFMVVTRHIEQAGEGAADEDPSSLVHNILKYQQFTLGSKQVKRRLIQAQHQLQHRVTPGDTQQQQQQQQLVQVCTGLLHQLDLASHLTPESASSSWLAALELADPAQQQLRQLQHLESTLLHSLDALLAGSSGLMYIDSKGAATSALQQGAMRGSSPGLNDSADDVSTAHPDASWQQPSPSDPGSADGSATNTSSSSGSGGGGGTMAQQAGEIHTTEPEQSVLVVPRSKSGVASLLRSCPDATARQQVYKTGLLPLQSMSSQLLGRLFRCRQQQVSLVGPGSLAERSSLQLLCGEPAAVADFLTSLAVGLGPAADLEVKRVLEPQAPSPMTSAAAGMMTSSPPAPTPSGAVMPQVEAGSQPGVACHTQHQEVCTDAMAAGAAPPAGLGGLLLDAAAADAGFGPWDWERQYMQYLDRQAPPPAVQQLAHHFTPQGIMAGWSHLLQQLLGVVLVPLMPEGAACEAAAGADGPRGSSAYGNPSLWPLDTWLGAPGQPWSNHVSAYSVVDVSCQDSYHVLGTIYLDWGGGYGCRVLQHSVLQPSSIQQDAVLQPSSTQQDGQLDGCSTSVDGDLHLRELSQQAAQHLLQLAQPWQVSPAAAAGVGKHSPDPSQTAATAVATGTCSPDGMHSSSNGSSQVGSDVRNREDIYHSSSSSSSSSSGHQDVSGAFDTAALTAELVQLSWGLPAAAIGLSSGPQQHPTPSYSQDPAATARTASSSSSSSSNCIPDRQDGSSTGSSSSNGSNSNSSSSSPPGNFIDTNQPPVPSELQEPLPVKVSHHVDHPADQQGEVPVVSLRLLWELGHELGHALHLVISGRQPYCVLSGRHLPRDLIELPSQLMERLLLSEATLSLVCRHCITGAPLPSPAAAATAQYFGARYNSPLAVQDRVCAALAEQLLSSFSDQSSREDFWGGAFQEWSSPAAVAGVAATCRQLALLPVVAHHRGTYWSYLHCWLLAAQLWQGGLREEVEQLAAAHQLGWQQQQGQQQQQRRTEGPTGVFSTAPAAAAAGPPRPPAAAAAAGPADVEVAEQQHPLRQVFLLNPGYTRQQLLEVLCSWGSPLAAATAGDDAVQQLLQSQVEQQLVEWLHPVQ